MAKTLKTSGDYNIKAGAGSSGTNQIKLDAKTTRVTGDLVIDGDQVTQNVTNTTIEDQFMEINRNYSGAGAQDAGIVFSILMLYQMNSELEHHPDRYQTVQLLP